MKIAAVGLNMNSKSLWFSTNNSFCGFVKLLVQICRNPVIFITECESYYAAIANNYSKVAAVTFHSRFLHILTKLTAPLMPTYHSQALRAYEGLTNLDHDMDTYRGSSVIEHWLGSTR